MSKKVSEELIGVLSERDPLYNLIIEKELLGALLFDNSFELEISNIIEPYHFGLQAHIDLYTLILSFIRKNKPATPSTLKSIADQMESLREFEGHEYLKHLYIMTSGVHCEINKHHAIIIKDLWQRRRIVSINRKIMDELKTDDTKSTQDLLDSQQQQLFEVSQTEDEHNLKSIKQILSKTVQGIEKAYKNKGLVGLSTGIDSIDEVLGGMYKGNLIIIAARPAMGKTSLAVNIAYNVAKKYQETQGEEGASVGIFSIEMSENELMHRLISQKSGISSYRLRQGHLTECEFHQHIIPSIREVEDLPICVDDSAVLSVDNIRSRARYFKRTKSLGLLVVDYLQLIQGTTYQKYQNRTQEVAEITRGLKMLAKDLDIPVIALSQLSRNVEYRVDKRPQLSDLRESGSIEQDADVVGFVYREEYYVKQQQPPEDSENFADWQEKMAEVHNRAEFIVAKQRSGPTGKAMLHFDKGTTTFYDLN